MRVTGDRKGVEAVVEFLKSKENKTALRREVEAMLAGQGLVRTKRDVDAIICAAEDAGDILYHDQAYPHLVELIRGTGAQS